MQLTGKAKVMLVHRGQKSETRYYRIETYLETRKPVEDFERLTADNTASQNTSVFEFGFFLPRGLPPSFVSPLKSNGYLRYILQLKKIDRGREKKLRKTKVIVAPYLTFEKIPSAGDLIARDRQGASPICCCGAERDITVRVWLDKAGVFAGTSIPFHALIINNSTHSIRSSYLTLSRHWVFRTSQKIERAFENVGSFRKVKRGTIPPGGTMTWGITTLQ
ncbi:uncharacterized protein LOC112557304 isoform X2 [Pomacea canaliculata]|nr:uncharacterized protein LOC112557304 isoform X2 [Pomacea canaliculata]